MKKRRFFRRALAIAMLATLASANAFGLSTKYYYQTKAKAFILLTGEKSS